MKTYSYSLLLSFVVAAFGTYAEPSGNVQPIDKRVVRHVDVTGDGEPETLALRVRGDRLTAPFSWTLSVHSKEKEIFNYNGDGTSFDRFFRDDGYVGNCRGYVECKQKFFYRDILDLFVVPSSDYSTAFLLDKSSSNSLYQVGRAYLKRYCGIEGAQAEAILSSMAERLRSGNAVVIRNVTSGVSFDPQAAMFAPEVGRFIPIYEP